MINPEVSIIIANYNTKDLIVSCLDSLEKYKPKIPFEIIVVDDASIDGSDAILKKYKNINLIVNNKNLGYVRSNNKGIKIAKGRLILLLNSDTVVKKDSIDKLVEFANKTPDAGVVGGQLLNLDGTVQESCFNFPSILNTFKNVPDKFYPKGKGPSVVDGVVGAVFLITQKARKKIPFLNEKFISYYEDVDYCRSVTNLGLKVYYLPSSQIFHHHGASFKKLSDPKNEWRKLIPSSKIYNGIVKHYIIFIIMWTRQKLEKLFNFFSINN